MSAQRRTDSHRNKQRKKQNTHKLACVVVDRPWPVKTTTTAGAEADTATINHQLDRHLLSKCTNFLAQFPGPNRIGHDLESSDIDTQSQPDTKQLQRCEGAKEMSTDAAVPDSVTGGGSFRPIPARMMQSRRASSTDEFVNESISNLAGVDENSAVLVKYAFMAIGVLSIIKFLSESLFYVYVLLLPIVYTYLCNTCPKQEDFNAKEELKPIIDGSHLPENHPSKPKGYFESLYSKAKASVASELSALTGMKEEYTSFFGAALLVTVTAPALGRKFYWVGGLNKFHFIHSTPIIVTTEAKKAQ